MRKQVYGVLLGCVLIFVFGGCDDRGKTPKCSDKQTTDLVLSIVRDELKKDWYMSRKMKDMSFQVESIRTIKHNKEIDSYECAAEIAFINKEKSGTHPITYTVESTDKEGDLYVTVHGL